MIEPNPERCARCNVLIVDPTTRRVAGAAVFCCANCSSAMQDAGLGSSTATRRHAGTFMCAHCDAPIVDESSMESRGDQPFCCRNCLVATETPAMHSSQRGTGV